MKLLINNPKIFSLISGSLLALAFAPFNFFPAAIISLTIFFLLLEDSKNKKTTFWRGFLFGYGFFLAGNYWICISLLVDAARFAWLIPFTITIIPSVLALYLALFALCYKYFNYKENYQKVLIFAALWIIFEFLRSHLFSGFPWNLLGYIWMFNENFFQSANLFGVLGLSFLAVLISLLPILFLQKQNKSDRIFAVFLIILFAANFFYGFFYIKNTELVIDDKTKLRLVQANIKQEMKWDPEIKYLNLVKTIDLTNSTDLKNINSVIWSETSVPYAISDELITKLKSAIPPHGRLITGALRIENDYEFKAFNSVFTISRNGVENFYDKHHLVPFGEYVPLQKYLPFIDKITEGAVGFSEGEGAKTLVSQGFTFSPLICYEIIFSGETVNKNSRPDLLVNVTNDAWFGVSSGPYQHLNMARMRAAEYGIALARVANTGITAYVDPFGRIVKKIDLNDEGVIDVDLIRGKETIYSKLMNWF